MSEFKEALFAVCQLAKRPAPHFENMFNGDSVLVEVIVIPHQPVRGAGHNLLAAEERAAQNWLMLRQPDFQKLLGIKSGGPQTEGLDNGDDFDYNKKLESEEEDNVDPSARATQAAADPNWADQVIIAVCKDFLLK